MFEAEVEAQHHVTGLGRRGKEGGRCLRSLQYALKRYQKGWNQDFETWWDDQPKRVHYVVNVERDVRRQMGRRGISRQRILTRIEELAPKSHITLVWPADSDDSLSIRERVELVYSNEELKDLQEGRSRLITSLITDRLLDPRRVQKVTSTDEELFEAAWKAVERIALHLVRQVWDRNSHLQGEYDALLHEAQVAVFTAIPKYKGKATFATFAYTVIQNALRDYAQQQLWCHERLIEETIGHYADPASLVDGWGDLISVLRTVPDADLLLLHAAGYKDRELEATHGRHIKARRHRAKAKVARMAI